MAKATNKSTIPADLVQNFRAHQVSLFIGSGTSTAAELPSWNDLVSIMIETIRSENNQYSAHELNEFFTKRDHLDIAEIFKQIVGEHRYFRFLREQYRREVRISKLHKIISSLPVRTIFTTNYDKLLEIAFRSQGRSDPAVIIFPEQLGYIDSSETRIVKLHGDIDHPSSIVLSRRDYADYASRHRDFVRMLEMSVNDQTILFIGFGLRDSNFRRIYQDSRSFYGGTQRRAYAIMSGTNAIDRRLWENEELVILPVNNNSEIPNYLRRVLEQIGKK